MNTLLINTNLAEHSLHRLHHLAGTCNVVNRRTNIRQILFQHLFVDVSSFSVPIFFSACHRWYEFEVGILFLQFLQLVEKHSILRTPSRIEKIDWIREMIVRGMQNHTAEWSDANSSCQENDRT